MVFGELDEGQFDGMSAEEIRTHKMECRLREFDIEGKTASEARSPLLVVFFWREVENNKQREGYGPAVVFERGLSHGEADHHVHIRTSMSFKDVGFKMPPRSSFLSGFPFPLSSPSFLFVPHMDFHILDASFHHQVI